MSHHQAILDTLRAHGHRITPQREMIIDILTHSTYHMSAEEIMDDLKHLTSAINVATVYRTLDLLWNEGVVNRNELGEGKHVYSADKHGPHLHLVCRHCRRIIEIDPDLVIPLSNALRKTYHFDVDDHHISLSGVCAHCQK